MTFARDFRRDFDPLDFFGPPFALVRLADGERAICTGRPIEGADGWRYAGGASRFRDDLLAALRYNESNYYLGLSDGCCDPEAKAWYLGEITVPLAQVTFSNLFVNANYGRFKAIDFSAAAIVASEGGDYWVPHDLINMRFDIDRLVERLLDVDRTIMIFGWPGRGDHHPPLLAAGEARRAAGDRRRRFGDRRADQGANNPAVPSGRHAHRGTRLHVVANRLQGTGYRRRRGGRRRQPSKAQTKSPNTKHQTPLTE